MSLDDLIARFGLLAVGVGSGVEGEPFALAGGLLAHGHPVPLWGAILAAILGAFLVDSGWFLLGRRFRAHRWVRRVADRPGFARSLASVERHPDGFILLFRFAYGIRALAPVAIGTTRVAAWRFLLLDAAAAIVWGTGFTLLGYAFGRALGPWVGDLALVGVAAGIGLLVLTLRGASGTARRG